MELKIELLFSRDQDLDQHTDRRAERECNG